MIFETGSNNIRFLGHTGKIQLAKPVTTLWQAPWRVRREAVFFLYLTLVVAYSCGIIILRGYPLPNVNLLIRFSIRSLFNFMYSLNQENKIKHNYLTFNSNIFK